MDSPGHERESHNESPAVERTSFRTGFLFGALNFLGMTLLGLVSTIVTSRVYGVRIIGEFALVYAPVAALNLLSNVKEQKALIREITSLPPRHPRVSELFAAVFTFSWGLTVVVALIDAVICWFVFPGPLNAAYLLMPTYVSIAGYVVVSNTNWNIDAIFSAFIAGRQLFWVRLTEVVGVIVIALGVGLVWHSVWGMVIATIGAAGLALIHRLILVRAFVRGRLTWGEYRAGLRVLPDLLRFGVKAAPGQIAQGASIQGGIWALGVVASTSVVGAYSRALSLPLRLQQAGFRIIEVLYPTLVARHSEGDGHGFDRALIDSIRYQVIGLLLVGAALGGGAESVLNVFGPGFAEATTALAVLSLFPAMSAVTVAQTQALWAVDRPGLTSLVSFVRLAVTTGLLIALTPSLGSTAPAIALVAGYVVGIVLSGIAVRPILARPLHATWPIRERLALVAAYAAGFGAAHAMERVTPSTAGVIACVSAGAAAYGATFLVCGGLNRRDRHRLGEALAWVKTPRARQPRAAGV